MHTDEVSETTGFFLEALPLSVSFLLPFTNSCFLKGRAFSLFLASLLFNASAASTYEKDKFLDSNLLIAFLKLTWRSRLF